MDEEVEVEKGAMKGVKSGASRGGSYLGGFKQS